MMNTPRHVCCQRMSLNTNKIVACDKFAPKRTRRSNPQNMPHYAPTNHSHAADAVVYWGEFLEYRLVQVPIPVVPVGT